MEIFYIMRQINHTFIALKVVLLTIIILSASSLVYGQATADTTVWRGYSVEQKQLAVLGFTDCYRSASVNSKMFIDRDIQEVLRLIDNSINRDNKNSLKNIIINSVKKAPSIKVNEQGERWEGPVGFHSGLWWRGIDDKKRQAYIQGVYWFAENNHLLVITSPKKSIRQVVEALNEWYIVSDDEWKDPRSNERVDLSVISALDKTHLLQIKNRATQR